MYRKVLENSIRKLIKYHNYLKINEEYLEGDTYKIYWKCFRNIGDLSKTYAEKVFCLDDPDETRMQLFGDVFISEKPLITISAKKNGITYRRSF